MNRLQNYIIGADTSPLVLPKVCFVCDDGACLAPIAAAVYNYLADRSAMNLHAVCAAASSPGRRVDPMAISALESLGIHGTPSIDLREYLPSALTEGTVSGCEAVVCLVPTRMAELMGRFPIYASRFASLSGAVPIPASGRISDYVACVKNIMSLIRKDFEF